MKTEEYEFLEDETQLENEEDIGALDQNSFSMAVVSGNDWTTETIINQINKGTIYNLIQLFKGEMHGIKSVKVDL